VLQPLHADHPPSKLRGSPRRMAAHRNRRAAWPQCHRHGGQTACDTADDEQFAEWQRGPVGGDGDPLRKGVRRPGRHDDADAGGARSGGSAGAGGGDFGGSGCRLKLCSANGDAARQEVEFRLESFT
jgi:hypothetical protein